MTTTEKDKDPTANEKQEKPDDVGIVVIGGNAIMTLRQAERIVPITRHVMLAAIRSGQLRGREVGGPRGSITTWDALCEWAAPTVVLTATATAVEGDDAAGD